MQSFSSESELKTFLANNPNETYGKYEVFIDDELEYSVNIVEGIKVNEELFKIEMTLTHSPCSFEGLRI